MKLYFFLFMGFYFFALPSHGQKDCSMTVKGKILDENNQPLPGATIVIIQSKTGKVSDVAGMFQFDNLCPGNYTLEIKFLGYITRQLKVDTKETDLSIVNLQPEEKILKEIVVEDKAEQITATSNSLPESWP